MQQSSCPFCGQPTRATSQFCTSCGRRLDEQPPPMQAATPAPPIIPPVPPVQPRSRKTVPVLLGAVALIAVIAIVATRGGNSPSPSPTPVRTTVPTQRPVARTPQELHQMLLSTPFDDAQLPQGYSGAKVESYELGELDKRHHAVGGVRATIQGPDYGDVMFLTVFPSDADAKAYFEEDREPAGSDKTGEFRPAGFDVPVVCDTWHHTGKGSDDPERGQTFCDALVGPVVIDVVTSLTTDLDKGNNEASVALTQSAIAHVRSLRGEA